MKKKHEALELIETHFGSIHDFRDERGKRHPLLEIIVIAILSIICGVYILTEKYTTY